jgi:DNA-binding transcriptional ArsR family regulator
VDVIDLTDPRALRAYAHPLRLKLIGLLRREGPLTATRTAELLGESSGSTSFHLRQLAKYGLVEETGEGTGREKPWRATALFTRLPDIAATPEAAEAADHTRAVIAARYHERFLDWIARSRHEPEEWQRAAVMTDRMLYLTVDELAQLGEQIKELVDEYSSRLVDRHARPEDSRLVTFVGLAFPEEP